MPGFGLHLSGWEVTPCRSVGTVIWSARDLPPSEVTPNRNGQLKGASSEIWTVLLSPAPDRGKHHRARGGVTGPVLSSLR
jgi:hypothetical protein